MGISVKSIQKDTAIALVSHSIPYYGPRGHIRAHGFTEIRQKNKEITLDASTSKVLLLLLSSLLPFRRSFPKNNASVLYQFW